MWETKYRYVTEGEKALVEEKLLHEAIIAPEPRVSSPPVVQFPLAGGNYSPSLLCYCCDIIPCEGRNLSTGTEVGILVQPALNNRCITSYQALCKYSGSSPEYAVSGGLLWSFNHARAAWLFRKYLDELAPLLDRLGVLEYLYCARVCWRILAPIYPESFTRAQIKDPERVTSTSMFQP